MVWLSPYNEMIDNSQYAQNRSFCNFCSFLYLTKNTNNTNTKTLAQHPVMIWHIKQSVVHFQTPSTFWPYANQRLQIYARAHTKTKPYLKRTIVQIYLTRSAPDRVAAAKHLVHLFASHEWSPKIQTKKLRSHKPHSAPHLCSAILSLQCICAGAQFILSVYLSGWFEHELRI